MKNKNAVLLGSLGGKARAKSLSPDRKKEISSEAAKIRWAKNKYASQLSKAFTKTKTKPL